VVKMFRNPRQLTRQYSEERGCLQGDNGIDDVALEEFERRNSTSVQV